MAKPKLNLRELTLEDARPYFELVAANRHHMNRFGTMTETRYTSLKEVAESIVNPPNPQKLRFGIWDNEILVGNANLVKKKNKRCEVGVWIGEDFTHKGYASGAINILTQYALKLGYTRIIATTYPDNLPSQQMLQKCGFTLTRRLKNRYYFAFQK